MSGSGAAFVSPLILALERRAGASGDDRSAWLAERRQGLTATEVRELKLHKVSMRTLALRKLGRTPEVRDLGRIPIIAYGRDREVVIGQDLEIGWGIVPESRVFRAEDDVRRLASPDGVGTYGFDEILVIDEIKTSGHDIDPGTQGYERAGYKWQMQWGMRVTGARRCLYVWEERIEVQKNVFRPGERHECWVERDDTEIAELDRLADEFFEVLADVAAEDDDSPIDEILDTHAVNYLWALQAEKEAVALKRTEWAAMLSIQKSQTSALARVTYSVPTSDVYTVDKEAARAADPDLARGLDDADAALSEARGVAQRAYDEHLERIEKAQRDRDKVFAAWAEHCKAYTTLEVVYGRPYLRVTAVKPPMAESEDSDD